VSKQFEVFKEELKYDPPISKEDAYALYGYYFGYYSFGEISLDELKELQKILGLTDNEVDGLSIWDHL